MSYEEEDFVPDVTGSSDGEIRDRLREPLPSLWSVGDQTQARTELERWFLFRRRPTLMDHARLTGYSTISERVCV